MEFNENTTWAEKYGRAMQVTTREEAAEHFERCVRHTMRLRPCDRAEAERVERANIGYWTGYYSAETAARVFELFGCEHPVFGRTQPTAEEAFRAGEEFARRKQKS